MCSMQVLICYVKKIVLCLSCILSRLLIFLMSSVMLANKIEGTAVFEIQNTVSTTLCIIVFGSRAILYVT